MALDGFRDAALHRSWEKVYSLGRFWNAAKGNVGGLPSKSVLHSEEAAHILKMFTFLYKPLQTSRTSTCNKSCTSYKSYRRNVLPRRRLMLEFGMQRKEFRCGGGGNIKQLHPKIILPKILQFKKNREEVV